MACGCDDWINLTNNDVFVKHPSYGWVLRWIVVTDEGGYAQINNYYVSMKYCPFCGKLTNGDT